jgi:hypothetical protein
MGAFAFVKASPTAIEDIEDFLRQHIDSLEQLEVLFLLRKQPAREWTAAELSGELRSSALSTARRLTDLVSLGLVIQREFAFGYRPQSDNREHLLKAVEAFYRERRVRVTELIYDGVRPGGGIRDFSEAFRIKKGK